MKQIPIQLGGEWVGKEIPIDKMCELEDTSGYEPFKYSSYTKKKEVAVTVECDLGYKHKETKIIKPRPRKNARVISYRKWKPKTYYIPVI